MIGAEDLSVRFDYHRPDVGKADRHQQVRGACHDAAQVVDQLCPDGREKSLAITKLEEAMMWANAAIAREHA